jgi:hypothetical protein
MKKLLMLALLSCGSYAFSYSTQELCQYKQDRYAEIWTEIIQDDMGLALYHLDHMVPVSAEDDMHQRLIKLYIYAKMKNRQAEIRMLEHIDQQAYGIYLDDQDCE